MQNAHYASNMDILLFKDLERLGMTGNFSQAAELSNISQPAFSRRIKALESWVGAVLVDRSRQPVKLTEAGRQILEAGLQSIARIEQERSQIIEAQASPDKYIVTFGAQHSISWRFFRTGFRPSKTRTARSCRVFAPMTCQTACTIWKTGRSIS